MLCCACVQRQRSRALGQRQTRSAAAAASEIPAALMLVVVGALAGRAIRSLSLSVGWRITRGWFGHWVLSYCLCVCVLLQDASQCKQTESDRTQIGRERRRRTADSFGAASATGVLGVVGVWFISAFVRRVSVCVNKQYDMWVNVLLLQTEIEWRERCVCTTS